jgi:flagellar hook assembly protein FlgD
VIRYGLPQAERVTVNLYNILGQLVRRYDEGIKQAGYYTIVWDGRTDEGGLLGSGMYICRFEAGKFREVKKVMLIR